MYNATEKPETQYIYPKGFCASEMGGRSESNPVAQQLPTKMAFNLTQIMDGLFAEAKTNQEGMIHGEHTL